MTVFPKSKSLKSKVKIPGADLELERSAMKRQIFFMTLFMLLVPLMWAVKQAQAATPFDPKTEVLCCKVSANNVKWGKNSHDLASLKQWKAWKKELEKLLKDDPEMSEIQQKVRFKKFMKKTRPSIQNGKRKMFVSKDRNLTMYAGFDVPERKDCPKRVGDCATVKLQFTPLKEGKTWDKESTMGFTKTATFSLPRKNSFLFSITIDEKLPDASSEGGIAEFFTDVDIKCDVRKLPPKKTKKKPSS